MEQNTPTGNQDRGGQPLRSRRTILFAAGVAGAAAVTDVCLGRGATPAQALSATHQRATPAWLTRLSSTPTNADWNALKGKLSTHKLVRPGQSDYNAARELFDPRFDSLRPSGIAYCKRPSDVAACVSFVTRFGLPVRVRSCGHSYEGWSSVNNGLIVDVSDMNSLHFGNGTVTAGSGIDLINFYAGLAARGKAVPGGSCPTVGLAGLALGGGVGVLGRQFGLTSDAIESLQIVTADGSTLSCNSTNAHSDLYWASRGGGGGNFGVATSFTFRTHDLRSLVVFFLGWPWIDAGRVVNAWQSWAPHANPNLWSNLHLFANTGGPPEVSVGGTFIGSIDGANRLIGQLYDKVGVKAPSHSVKVHSYLSAMLLEAGCETKTVHACNMATRVPSFAKSDFFTKPLNSAGISALLRGIERLATVRGAAGGNGSIALDAMGGAVNRVHPQATAFVHRNALFLAQYITGWTSPGSAAGIANQRRWINSYYNAVHPHASGQAYQNYIDASLANWRVAYYGINYTRLSEIKAKYDPHQLFRFPQGITPPTQVACVADAAPDC